MTRSYLRFAAWLACALLVTALDNGLNAKPAMGCVPIESPSRSACRRCRRKDPCRPDSMWLHFGRHCRRWNSWNAFGPTINEEIIKDTADRLVALGLRDAG